jgi:pantoate--beta-alanine ligase
MVERDGTRDAALLKQALERHIGKEPLARIDYVAVTDYETLEELTVVDRSALVLLAVRIGATRLIDNATVVPANARVSDVQGGAHNRGGDT